jgi:hypothetical protein
MVTEIPRLMWTLCLGGVNSVTDHQVGFCVFLGVVFLIFENLYTVISFIN